MRVSSSQRLREKEDLILKLNSENQKRREGRAFNPIEDWLEHRLCTKGLGGFSVNHKSEINGIIGKRSEILRFKDWVELLSHEFSV